MLTFRDFFHLPQTDPYLQAIIKEPSGLIVVAGLDARPAAAALGPSGLFLPSGRAAMADLLQQEMLAAGKGVQAVWITGDKKAPRLSRQDRRKVKVLHTGPDGYTPQIEEAARRSPGLIVIDRLTTDNLPSALQAGCNGLKVISQMDTVLRGASLERQIAALGAGEDLLEGLAWVMSVQRFPALCHHCRQPEPPGQEHRSRFTSLYPHLEDLASSVFPPHPSSPSMDPQPDKRKTSRSPGFCRAGGCQHCRSSGRLGDVAAFDLYLGGSRRSQQPAALPDFSLEAYALHLASLGYLPLEDIFQMEQDQLRRTYFLLAGSESALRETNLALQRKVAELESANKVLLQRTDVMVSLQEISQALAGTDELYEVAVKVCRKAAELCRADRVVVYRFFTGADAQHQAEILAAGGWKGVEAGQVVDPDELLVISSRKEPAVYAHLPPGVPQPSPGDFGTAASPLLAGLSVPLIAQDKRVGLMVVQSTQTVRFSPGDTALLETFASQAALAVQRAALLADLRAKIAQLEEAQVELVKKERLEHELDLARQVQQSMLPDTFPDIPPYRFAARNLPARQVGGDFYDVFELDSDHFGFLIGDVSDKGMPAALFMALTRSLIRAEALRELSPEAVLARANHILFTLGEPQQFVSVFYGVIDLRTHLLRYSRAGHDRPFLMRGGQVIELGGEGMVLAVLQEPEFQLEAQQLQMEAVDRLVLYTDGVTDAQDGGGRFYGKERFERLLVQNAALEGDALCSGLFDELGAYQGDAEQFDDITILVVDFSG